MHRCRRSCIAAGLLVLGSGCSQPASSFQPAQTAAAAVPSNRLPATPKGDVLYVNAFGIQSYVGNPRKLVSTLSLQDGGMAVDAAGHVYVSDFFHNQVLVYTSETKKLIRTIDRNMKKPTALAVASDGTLYAVNRMGVSIFPHAKQLRMKRINHIDVFAIALDAQNNLYVADAAHNQVLEYAAGTNTLVRTVTTGIVSPVAIAFDSTGNMYVANAYASGQCGNDANSGSVTVYAPSMSAPLYTITTSQGLCEPRAFAFDASGNLYVANTDSEKEFAGSVTEYSAGTSSLLQTITNGIGNPNSLAIDAAGKLYVSNTLTNPYGGDVTVYNPANGNLVQTIATSQREQPAGVLIGK